MAYSVFKRIFFKKNIQVIIVGVNGRKERRLRLSRHTQTVRGCVAVACTCVHLCRCNAYLRTDTLEVHLPAWRAMRAWRANVQSLLSRWFRLNRRCLGTTVCSVLSALKTALRETRRLVPLPPILRALQAKLHCAVQPRLQPPADGAKDSQNPPPLLPPPPSPFPLLGVLCVLVVLVTHTR